ncbi:LexA family transcriptional regulator [Blastochloris tepida]|uniref:DNA-binding protein n=1 Tax=Blastochloris tepida TaxID=2233851 RepID=A0A348G5P7_9HYPH|nr:helix-turn-helix transcriptional regulator [Blastochloris tepida]BBF94880.1 DNA-binding protein [Blastochloris tepida]
MLTHGEIWAAIDKLAERHGLSTSGLAKRAGLDPTTFNRSKRITSDGRPRWPSTESIAKILSATGESVDAFMSLLSGISTTRRTVPLIGLAQAGEGGIFDDAGFPVGTGWDAVEFPAIGDENAYALEITGDSMAPAYRDGCVVIVSPNSPVRRGDRVVVRLKNGEVMAKELKRLSAKTLELKSLNPEHADLSYGREDVAWIARILWASQ